MSAISPPRTRPCDQLLSLSICAGPSLISPHVRGKGTHLMRQTSLAETALARKTRPPRSEWTCGARCATRRRCWWRTTPTAVPSRVSSLRRVTVNRRTQRNVLLRVSTRPDAPTSATHANSWCALTAASAIGASATATPHGGSSLQHSAATTLHQSSLRRRRRCFSWRWPRADRSSFVTIPPCDLHGCRRPSTWRPQLYTNCRSSLR